MTAKRIRLIVAFGLAALLITWVLQYAGLVQTRSFLFTVTTARNGLLAITALLGVGAGVLLALYQTGPGRKRDKRAAQLAHARVCHGRRTRFGNGETRWDA